MRAANEQLKMALNEVRAQLHASEAQLARLGRNPARFQSTRDQLDTRRSRRVKRSEAQRQPGEDSRAGKRPAKPSRYRRTRGAPSPGADKVLARASPSWSEKLRPVGKSFRNSKRCALTMAESEHSSKSLREEIQHHEQEAARWQARIAEADANREQMARCKNPTTSYFQTCIAGRNAARAPAGFIVSSLG